MLIGELAKKSMTSRDTIRWYEKIGLLTGEDSVRGSNNYRVYNEASLEKLILIRQCKTFGFSLTEVKAMLGLLETDNVNCDVVSPLVHSKIASIDLKIGQLLQIRNKLTTLIERCEGNCQEQILAAPD